MNLKRNKSSGSLSHLDPSFRAAYSRLKPSYDSGSCSLYHWKQSLVWGTREGVWAKLRESNGGIASTYHPQDFYMVFVLIL